MTSLGNTRTAPDDDGKILIIGGYGHVGRLIAGRLAPLFPDRIIIAGRNIEKAKTVATVIGHGVEGRAIDIFTASSNGASDGAVPENVTLVLVCIDQNTTRFAEQCLNRGICYIDISADYGFLSQLEKLDQLAKQKSACVVLSVGVAPGLTNLLAARVKQKMDSVERIEILLEFGLGDDHGQAAVEWMFDNLDATFEIRKNGQVNTVQSFDESINIGLSSKHPARPAYCFNFSDQHVIGRTLGVPDVSTWVRFEDRFSTWLFAKASQAGLGKLLRRRRWRKIAVWLFLNVHMGSDSCGVAVRAMGRAGNNTQTQVQTIGIIGRKEALMTAIVAAETVRQVLSGKLPPGVHHSEQVIKLDPVVSALKDEMPDIAITL